MSGLPPQALQHRMVRTVDEAFLKRHAKQLLKAMVGPSRSRQIGCRFEHLIAAEPEIGRDAYPALIASAAAVRAVSRQPLRRPSSDGSLQGQRKTAPWRVIVV
jgi:hypothetical protein